MKEAKGWKDRIWEKYVLDIEGSKRIIHLLKISCVMEVFAFFIDLWPGEYWTLWLEEFFGYDFSYVIPVVAITWGAAAIPLGFLLGQIERRNYGIRLADLLYAAWKRKSCCFIVFSFGFQLFLIMLSAIGHTPILLFVVSFVQILYVFFAFYIVILSLSPAAIRKIIKEQGQNRSRNTAEQSKEIGETIRGKTMNEQAAGLIAHEAAKKTPRWLLTDMIRNLDYSSLSDVESLEDILETDVCWNLQGIAGRKSSFDLFALMLSAAEQNTVHKIIMDVFCGQISLDARKGILGALIAEKDLNCYRHCEILLQYFGDKTSDPKELFCWTILWSIHQQIFLKEPMEKIQNMVFIDHLRRMMKRYNLALQTDTKSVNELVWQSCLDVVLLKETDAIDRIVTNWLENRIF